MERVVVADLLRENLRLCDLGACAFRFVSDVAALDAPESLPLRRKRPTLLETEENDLRNELPAVDEKDGRLAGVRGGRSGSSVGTRDRGAPFRESAAGFGVSTAAGVGDALVLSARGCLTTTGRGCDDGM